MKKKLGVILLTLVLAVALAIPTVIVNASPDTMMVVSDSSTQWSSDGSTWSATTPCYVHPSWPAPASISGATWVWRGEPQNPATEYDTVPAGGWYFQKTFSLPVGAVPTSGSISIGADNAYSLEVNGSAIGGDGALNRDGPDSAQWNSIETYDISLALTTGANTFNIRAINYFKVLLPPYPPTYSPGYNYDSPTLNPAGLVFKATIEYTLATLSTLTPEIDYNPVGTTHTVYATITPAVAGVPITFTVSGANSDGGTVNTNASGVAEFTYTGTNPGQDTITATVGDVTLSVTKYWLEHFVTGGGNITEGRGKSAAKITFGGNVGYTLEGNMVGNWNIVLHNVNNDNLDKGHIKITTITEIVFANDPAHPELVPDPPDADYHYAHFVADVLFNGEDLGWWIKVSVTDYGEGNKTTPDEIRIRIYNGIDATPIYDTDGEFTQGIWHRTPLDGGNIQIHPPEIPMP